MSINILEERLNYLSILSIENEITKSLLSYEEAINEHSAEGRRREKEMFYRGVSES